MNIGALERILRRCQNHTNNEDKNGEETVGQMEKDFELNLDKRDEVNFIIATLIFLAELCNILLLQPLEESLREGKIAKFLDVLKVACNCKKESMEMNSTRLRKDVWEEKSKRVWSCICKIFHIVGNHLIASSLPCESSIVFQDSSSKET